MAKVIVPISTGYEDAEFEHPARALRQAGHEVITVGPKKGVSVSGKRGESSTTIDATPEDVDVASIGCVLIPGGNSPDHLRTEPAVVRLISDAIRSKKPIAAICHGPQLLIEAQACRGLRMTSVHAIRTDLINAGAHWEDKSVVRDGDFITSRAPADLPEFTETVLARLG